MDNSLQFLFNKPNEVLKDVAVHTQSSHNITLPDIQFTDNDTFSTFRPECMEKATLLITTFLNAKNVDELKLIAMHYRDKINKQLFFYALYVVLYHRKDCKTYNIPNFVEVFPSLFMESAIINKALNTVSEDKKKILEIPPAFTASNLEPEHKLAYFREDIAVNLHHYHWHLIYPHTQNYSIVNKDRRGELFYYMHQQIMARYNFERLSNGINRVVSLKNFEDPIPEGYFPKITNNKKYQFPARPPNMKLSDIRKEKSDGSINVKIEHLKLWKNRLYEAIHKGYALTLNDAHVKLGEQENGDLWNGIDILGNLIESSILSINKKYYGNFHNELHDLVAHIHDPDYRYLEENSVMGDNSTAMRDPIFYRVHSYIDDLFYEHKLNIPPYTFQDLEFPDVELRSLELFSDDNHSAKFVTFWEKATIDISRGLSTADQVLIKYTRLQHKKYKFEITVNIPGKEDKHCTVRIFLAPSYNEHGNEFQINEQNRLFIELDKFYFLCRPGINKFSRSNEYSTVSLHSDLAIEKNTAMSWLDTDCKCGWPNHLLIPKGAEGKGLKCDLFVMISDHSKDIINSKTLDCFSSYCGAINEKYPDKRPMGYPFDRPWADGDTFWNLYNKPSNMIKTTVHIVFENDK